MENMEKDLRTLRKKEDNLMISGIAVLLFSVWDMVRFVMALIINPKILTDYIEGLGFDADDILIGEITVIAIYVVILALALLIRLFIFFGARDESKGKRRGWIYVIVAFIVLVFIIADEIDTAIDLFKDASAQTDFADGMDTAAASGLMNIMSAVALIDIIISSITVKKLRKKYDIKDGEVV